MSTINVSNLILTLQQKINSSTNERDLLYYSKAIQQLKSAHIFSVSNVSNLPNAVQNPGLVYYVQDNETVYFSNDFGWTEIYRSSITPLFTWGGNPSRQLGDGTLTSRCSPDREICSATDWRQVSVGSAAMAAIKITGELWAWGNNSCGRLGDGTTVNSCSPVREFCSATDWCQVSTGFCHTAAIKTSGELWTWGYNQCGRLGDGTTFNRSIPVREICSATDWCGVSVSRFHSTAVKTSGELWTWGLGSSGLLGDGTNTTRCSPVREFCSATDWCGVSAGRYHTAAIKTTGQLWAWGCNACGRLGDGTTTARFSSVRERCSATDWCQVSAGSCHTAAIKTSGELWAWGSGACRHLGDGTTVDRCSPVREFCSATDWCGVSAGECHTAAIKTSGELWAWGSNTVGQIGDGTTVGRCSPVREFFSATDWCQLSAGGYNTAAIKIRSV